MKVVLFTDTIGDLNGVSRFIQDMAIKALDNSDELHVISSTRKYCPDLANIHNFNPSFRITMPFYKELDLAFPPKEKIITKLDEINPDLIHISTPGPLGLLGRKLAKKKKIPMIGTYHTDFPAYIRDNTNSKILKKIADKFFENFYKDFIHLFSRSKEYYDVIEEDINFSQQKMSYIRAGTNLNTFSEKYRDEKIWEKYHIPKNSIKVLYVGRVSKEKNIPFLLRVWKEVYEKCEHKNISLILIGQGSVIPKAKKMEGMNVFPLGPVIGKDLSSFYASSDFFVFPSNTDTLGQVVMESQASGIPVVVSDMGGPKSLVNLRDKSGFIVEKDKKEDWVRTILHLLRNPVTRERAGKNAQKHMEDYCISKSYEDFMGVHKEHYESL